MSFFNHSEDDSEQSPEQELTEDQTLDEVEVRLHKAQYYRAVLDNDLFGGDDSDVAAQVGAEFREFALTRLRVLLGIEQEKLAAQPVELPFTEEEIEALQMWANKLLTKPALLQQSQQASVAPQVTPVMTRPEVKPRPQLTPVVSPAPPPPQRPTVKSKPVQKEVIKPRSQPKTPAKPAKLAKKAVKEETLAPGVKIDENGEKYFEQTKEVVGKDGKVTTKVVKMSVNETQIPQSDPNYKPMPTPAQLQMVSQSMAQAGAGIAQNRGFGDVMNHFMNTGANEVSSNDSGI